MTAWRIALTGSHAPVGIGRVGHLSEQSDRSRPEVRSRRRGPGFTTNGTVIRSGCDRVERVETGPVGRCATQPETSRSLWFPRDTGAGLRTLASAVAEHPRRIRCEPSSRRTGNVHESASRSLSARGGFWDYGSRDGGEDSEPGCGDSDHPSRAGGRRDNGVRCPFRLPRSSPNCVPRASIAPSAGPIVRGRSACEPRTVVVADVVSHEQQ